MRFKIYLTLLAILIIIPAQALAQEVDDLATFSSVAPDALIILDQSANMNLAPAGETMWIAEDAASCGTDVAYYGRQDATHRTACTINPNGTVPKFSDSTCSGPFYINANRDGYTTNCRRVEMVKRAIYSVLDDNQNNTINNNDVDSLGIRFGYMRFTACSGDESDGYSAGCNKIVKVLGSKYSSIFCSSSSSCSPTDTGTNSINSATASALDGRIPLVTSLEEAKLYLNYSKLIDSTSCRQKYVILITGGLDNVSCNGNGTDNQEDMYKRRRYSVRKAKELADAGYKLFVVNIGSNTTHYMRNTLNWMAYYGGTDNPIDTNNGETSGFNPTSYGNCENSTTAHHDLGAGDHFYAVPANGTNTDPGEEYLTGYAFMSRNENELKKNLGQIATIVRESTFSFSQVSVQSTRTQDENFLYEGSFQTVPNDPFWLGHLKKYTLNPDGTVGAEVWDAGNRLQSLSSASRNIKTYLGGSLVDFTSSNVTLASLGVSSDTERTRVIEFIRGNPEIDPSTYPQNLPYNSEYWKLGDVFRSTPITVGTPSVFFYDMNDQNKAFDQFRAAHIRTSAAENNKRIILTGANDGQMHAFHTGTGYEAWSFIPPNLLSKLKLIAHQTNPSYLPHSYFVDGPIGIADVWVGTTSYQNKNASDWKTIMVISEGRGGHDTLWSSSPNCDSGFDSVFSSANPYYCGYFALDITETLSPQYQWGRISYTASPTSNDPDPRPYLGDPWSKVMIGKVLKDGQEKWVGFVGAGYNGAACTGGGACETRGKGFYIIDIATGAIIWSYTMAINSDMVYSVAAAPCIVDSDSDGFIDTVYVGDLGGNMWRFKLCLGTEPYCTWSGGRLFQASTASGIRPVYTSAAAARDPNRKLWVYWGTGDKTDPTAANAQEKLYAVVDGDRTTTYIIASLDNITTKSYDAAGKPAGWYMNFSGNGEKMLGDPTIFGGVIYITTYTPSQSNDPCSQAGTGSLYALNYTTGSGILSGGARSMDLGAGIPSPPIVSMKPGNAAGADLYVTTSGGSGTGASTRRANLEPPGVANRTNVLFWRDKRVQ